MGDESNGISLQYQHLSLSGQSASSIALGISVKQKTDVVVSYSKSSLEFSESTSDISAESYSLLLTFFPAREENDDDLFTGEFVAGIGRVDYQTSEGYQLTLGTSISKALFEDESGNNLRPRLSAGYALTTANMSTTLPSSYGPYHNTTERTQVGVGITFSAELIADLRFNESIALVMSPSLNFIPQERQAGFGINGSFVF